MNKGNATIITIIGICILAAIAIYLYSHSKTDIEQNSMEETTNTIEKEVDLINGDADDSKEIINNTQGIATTDTTTAANISEQIIQDVDVPTAQFNNISPETGPGYIAFIIATVSATIFAFVVYKKQVNSEIV